MFLLRYKKYFSFNVLFVFLLIFYDFFVCLLYKSYCKFVLLYYTFSTKLYLCLDKYYNYIKISFLSRKIQHLSWEGVPPSPQRRRRLYFVFLMAKTTNSHSRDFIMSPPPPGATEINPWEKWMISILGF